MLIILSLLLPLCRFLICGLCLLLAAHFVLMIFYPGNREMLGFFKSIQPMLSVFNVVTGVLILPLQWISDLIHPLLPSNMAEMFPSAPAGKSLNGLGRFLGNLPGMDAIGVRQFFATNDYTQDYKGAFLWLDILAIPIWLGVLQGVERPVSQWIDIQQNKMKEVPNARPLMVDSIVVVPTTPELDHAKAQEAFNVAPGKGSSELRELLKGLKEESTRLHQQKEEIKSQFSHYFSPTVLKYLEAHRDQFQAFSNQKHVLTIMCCDIRNFTHFSQTHSPEETAAYLSRFFDLVNDVVIRQYEGTLNKLIGDALMAYWGFPVKEPDHAYFATQAAISILYAIKEWNQKQEGFPYEIGIGLYTGEVLVGNIGSRDFMDFTLVGDPVNLAARLEGATRTHNAQLLISEETYRGLNDRILCRRVGPLEVKGWEGQLYAYEPHYYK